jgi:hypothetical protein
MERWFPPNRGEPTGLIIASRCGSRRSEFLAGGHHSYAGADAGSQDLRGTGEISLAILAYGKPQAVQFGSSRSGRPSLGGGNVALGRLDRASQGAGWMSGRSDKQ